MSAFPTLTKNPSYESKWEPIDDIKLTRATNGTAHTRGFYTGKKYGGVIVYENCSSADVTAVNNFYATNRLLAFTWTWIADGNTYTNRFPDCPKCDLTIYGTYKIRVPMQEE